MSWTSSNYKYSVTVKNNDLLRASFNELTRQTFGFDFVDWYESGHWGEMYIPHSVVDGEKVVSNVSVNLMQFDMGGVKKNYIQLGTVMTDTEYREQGWNRRIMERILKEYEGKADGIYLFGNDSVLNYYPRFGFRPSKEYEYYMPWNYGENIVPYVIEKVDMSQEEQSERLYDVIRNYSGDPAVRNQNDAMCMSDNLGLYQFWMAAGFGESIYYLPETGTYASADAEEGVLRLHQIFGKARVDIARLAKAFGEAVKEVVLEYTPVHKAEFLVREHREDDCTLFLLGEDLERIEKEKLRFPVLSHA
ncbi:MAG: GNAT family N-acetyltransferase [Lachnospiraceae bacterium]|nr:GNAT family N-acetyltransferase [Lachnospiraceae bacterium]